MKQDVFIPSCAAFFFRPFFFPLCGGEQANSVYLFCLVGKCAMMSIACVL